MKIDDPQPPVSDPSVNADLDADDENSSPSGGDDQPSAFSKLLAKKKGAEQETSQRAYDRKSDGLPSGGAVFARIEAAQDPSMTVGQVQSKQVALPADLQQLVREISVVVNQAGSQQVHIELNSSILKGLHIRIERHEGTLAIQFQSESEQVTNLLSKNVEALSQGLATLGERAVEIRVAGPKELSKGATYKNRDGQAGRGPSSYGGGRR